MSDRAPGHIDEEVLDRLVADLGPLQAAEVCQLFLADAHERVAAVRAACEAGDVDRTARSAHRLKSASGFVGAGGVSSLCREIEDLARQDQLDQIPDRVDRVTDELEQASGELAAYLRRLPPPSG